MKILTSLILCAALVGCSTVPTTTTSTVTPVVASQITTDTAVVVGMILAKNPSYKASVAILGKTLPSLLAVGPITPDAYAVAVAGIPGVTATERGDLLIAGAALDLALNAYEASSGKSVALFTDPNVAAIVNAFAAGLTQAAGS